MDYYNPEVSCSQNIDGPQRSYYNPAAIPTKEDGYTMVSHSQARQADLSGRIVLRDGQTARWLVFAPPVRVVSARHLDEVLPALDAVLHAVNVEGYYASGFVAYEAAPAFDRALATHDAGDFPLLWFALSAAPDEIDELQLASPDSWPAFAWTPSISPATYQRAITTIREHIAYGDTYQVNFTYRLRGPVTADPWMLFAQLARADDPPYGAFVDTGDWAICSLSPELFFTLRDTTIVSRPMKGTLPRGLWPADDREKAAALRASEKDRAENVMIVDMVRNDLGHIAEVGSVRVPALFALERYPTVWQMTSTVEAQTAAPLDQILTALFPAASITGAPKRRTMRFIRELETTPRRIYTGAIGFIAPDRRAQFNVAIRTLLIHKDSHQAEYGVGGGIVWDSHADGEWAESQVKARVLQPPRPAFDLLETLRWTPEGDFWLLDLHLARLAQSADYFGYRIDLARVQHALAGAVAHLPAAPHKVRLLVNRAGACQVQASPLEPPPAGVPEIALARAPIEAHDPFLYHKTTNRQVYDAARAARPEVSDVLLYNERGDVTETTIANVVVDIAGRLCTPPVSCGLLAGTHRAWLLAQGQIHERVVSVTDVLHSPDVYLINAVRGMWRVRVVGVGIGD